MGLWGFEMKVNFAYLLNFQRKDEFQGCSIEMAMQMILILIAKFHGFLSLTGHLIVIEGIF